MIFVLFGILWGGFLAARHITGVGQTIERFENITADWRFEITGLRLPPRGVVIAAIDDDTVREAGGFPLPRERLARIIRGLAAANPLAIAVDLLFLDEGQPADDLELVDALRSTKAVTGAVALFGGENSPVIEAAQDLALVPSASRILLPIPKVTGVTRAGLVNVAIDASGALRYIPMIVQDGNKIMPSFALAAASAALNTEPVLASGNIKLMGTVVDMDMGYYLPIRYYGPRGSIRQFSAAQVLHGTLDQDALRGQLVVVGATAVGVGDKFATPFDQVVPGVEIMATAISNLLAGGGLIRTRVVRAVDASAAIALPVATVLLVATSPSVLGIALVVALVTAWVGFATAAFTFGYWFSIAMPLAAWMPVAIGYGVARLILDRRLTRRLAVENAALAKFQSPGLIRHILRNPGFLEKPVRQDVAVIFVDLSGFTGVSEMLGPELTRDLLADFQSMVERSVTEHDGYVVSFMGDGAMVLFGLPSARTSDASRALLTIINLRNSLAEWLRTLPPVARESLGLRLAGHFGPAVVSRLGPIHHQHVTASGDTVNVASRLLEIAKQRRATTVVSSDLWSAVIPPIQLADHGFDASSSDANVRGRARPVRIHVCV